MSRSFFSLIDYSIQQIFLPECIYCLKPAVKGPFCADCFRIPLLTGNHCQRCGEPLPIPLSTCGFCRRREYKAIDEVCSLAWLTPAFHKLLLHIKYYKQTQWLPLLKNTFATSAFPIYSNSPLVVPIPISFRRWMTRGFNQTEILSQWISKQLSLVYCGNLLKKDSRAVPQSSLGEQDRKTALAGHFSLNADIPIPESVLLIDDIFTTGYTLDHAARCLKKQGVKKVSALTLFRTPLRSANIQVFNTI